MLAGALGLLLQTPDLQGVLHDLAAEDPAARHHASADLKALDPSLAPRLENLSARADPEAAARLREAAAYLRWKGRFSNRARREIPELLDLLRRGSPGEIAVLYDKTDAALHAGRLDLRDCIPIWVEGVSDDRDSGIPLIDYLRGGGSPRNYVVDELARNRLYGRFGNRFRGEREAWRSWWAALSLRPESDWKRDDP